MHYERLPVWQWQPGMRTADRTVQEVSKPFHGRCLVKYINHSTPVVMSSETIYAMLVLDD